MYLLIKKREGDAAWEGLSDRLFISLCRNWEMILAWFAAKSELEMFIPRQNPLWTTFAELCADWNWMNQRSGTKYCISLTTPSRNCWKLWEKHRFDHVSYLLLHVHRQIIRFLFKNSKCNFNKLSRCSHGSWCCQAQSWWALGNHRNGMTYCCLCYVSLNSLKHMNRFHIFLKRFMLTFSLILLDAYPMFSSLDSHTQHHALPFQLSDCDIQDYHDTYRVRMDEMHAFNMVSPVFPACTATSFLSSSYSWHNILHSKPFKLYFQRNANKWPTIKGDYCRLWGNNVIMIVQRVKKKKKDSQWFLLGLLIMLSASIQIFFSDIKQ